jgi:hypothetical protein
MAEFGQPVRAVNRVDAEYPGLSRTQRPQRSRDHRGPARTCTVVPGQTVAERLAPVDDRLMRGAPSEFGPEISPEHAGKQADRPFGSHSGQDLPDIYAEYGPAEDNQDPSSDVRVDVDDLFFGEESDADWRETAEWSKEAIGHVPPAARVPDGRWVRGAGLEREPAVGFEISFWAGGARAVVVESSPVAGPCG